MNHETFGAEYLESGPELRDYGASAGKFCIVDPWGSGATLCYTAGYGWRMDL